MGWSRRRVIAGLFALVAASFARRTRLGAQGLGDFGMAGPPCAPGQTPTPTVPADRTYRAGAPVRSSLVDASTPGMRLKLSGTVAGTKCGRIKGAEVEIWHADARGAYDGTGDRFRGRQVTDADGQFAFDTIIPGAVIPRARHIGVHVVVPGKKELWTELFFADDVARLKDGRYKPELTLKVANGRAAFDLLLDL